MGNDYQNKRQGSISTDMIANYATVKQPVSSYTPKYLDSNDYWRSPWILNN
jgi:hypothetical protein